MRSHFYLPLQIFAKVHKLNLEDGLKSKPKHVAWLISTVMTSILNMCGPGSSVGIATD